MHAWVGAALEGARTGTMVPFATYLDGTLVGSTRFGAIVPEHLRAEIGWTWIAPRWQRTPANGEAKLLMLTHAFEVCGLRRVEFKTDVSNVPSRAALRRIGATEEGVLRRHMVMAEGRPRDTVYASILDVEWPEVKRALVARLAG